MVNGMMKRNFGRAMALCSLALMLGAALVPAAAFGAMTDDSEATVVFEGGGLNLIETPDFNFGRNTIDEDTVTFTAVDDAVVEIKDLRGTLAGYHLTAELSVFKEGGNNSLDGAKITLTDGLSDYKGQGETPNGPTVASPINMVAGGASQDILNAAVSAGSGYWDATWTNTNSILTVPIASQTVGTHQAQIDWVLTDAPA
jgi:hypothetical protein